MSITLPAHCWAQYETVDRDGTRITHLGGSHPATSQHPSCPLCAVTGTGLLCDIVTKYGDPTIPRCPWCKSEETYEDRSPHHRRITCYCSECNFSWSPQSRQR